MDFSAWLLGVLVGGGIIFFVDEFKKLRKMRAHERRVKALRKAAGYGK